MTLRNMIAVAAVCLLVATAVPLCIDSEDSEVDATSYKYTIHWYDYDGNYLGNTSDSQGGVLENTTILILLNQAYPESEGYILGGWYIQNIGVTVHNSSLTLDYLDYIYETQTTKTTNFRFYAQLLDTTTTADSGTSTAVKAVLAVAVVGVIGVASYAVYTNLRKP